MTDREKTTEAAVDTLSPLLERMLEMIPKEKRMGFLALFSEFMNTYESVDSVEDLRRMSATAILSKAMELR